jgi:hypothetical protein
MGAVNNYSTEFPIRTLKLLKSFQDKKIDYKLNVTFLMNCLLGLIVTAVENSERRQLIQGNVDDEMLGFIPDNVELKIGNQPLLVHPKALLKTRGKLSTLKKIRNSIAHQHVEPHNQNNNWIGVTLWNVHPQDGIDFRIELTTAQLNSLANYITNHYLQSNN